MQSGFRAIPAVPSTDPTVAACFYEVGDYTCVKDAAVGHWDPSGSGEPGSTDGCWRMVEDGRRYLADGWDAGNLDTRRAPEDVCNGYRKGPSFI